MDAPKNPTKADSGYFRRIYEDSGFWSCCGYDGLSVAFDLPLEDLRSLPEEQKQTLMHLLAHLAGERDEALLDRIRGLETLATEERLAGLVSLGSRLAG